MAEIKPKIDLQISEYVNKLSCMLCGHVLEFELRESLDPGASFRCPNCKIRFKITNI